MLSTPMRDARRLATLIATMAAAGCQRAQAASALPDPVHDAPLATVPRADTAVFAGGCFWGVQAVFQHVKGVLVATSGYAGGTRRNPSYEDVSSGSTGHAESVRVIYDPSQVSYGQLLKIFFSVAHDPTELNRQGPDEGTQYRSAIFVVNAEQEALARAYIAQLTREKVFADPIVTEVSPLKAFFAAEAYHQNYATLHPTQPYIAINDAPKVEALRKQFGAIYTDKLARAE
jgi:peptide-methionine (S)-S-oxide reductase